MRTTSSPLGLHRQVRNRVQLIPREPHKPRQLIPRTTHHAPRTTHHAPRTTHHAPRTTHHAPRHAPRTTHHAAHALPAHDEIELSLVSGAMNTGSPHQPWEKSDTAELIGRVGHTQHPSTPAPQHPSTPAPQRPVDASMRRCPAGALLLWSPPASRRIRNILILILILPSVSPPFLPGP